MKTRKYLTCLLLAVIIILSGCGSKNIEISSNEIKLLSGEDTKNIDTLRELAVSKSEKAVALVEEKNGKWIVVEAKKDSATKTSKEYLEVGEVLYGQNKLVFSAKNGSNKWIIVENFTEKENTYDQIFDLALDKDDGAYFVGERDGKDFIVKNYIEQTSYDQITGLAVSKNGNYVCSIRKTNGDWTVVDETGKDQGTFTYTTEPKYFENDSWAAIAREGEATWVSIINGEKSPLFQNPVEVSYFALNEDNKLSYVFMKENGKWALVYPSTERSQEYNSIKEPVYDKDGEVVYIDLPRYEGRLYEIRTGRKETVLAEGLYDAKYLNIINDNIVYSTKTKGGNWEIRIGNKSVGSYKNTSNFYVQDNKLVFAAESKEGGIFYVETSVD